MQENISSILTKTISIQKNDFETNLETVEVEAKMENVFRLRNPVVYKMEDLLMSFSILLFLFIMLIIWYGVTRFIIFLAYSKTSRRVKFIDVTQDDFSSA